MSVRLINYSEADVDMRDVELRDIRPLDGRASERSLQFTRHSIFLSHSGFQKPFVEQLCWDLENRGHTVFFDKNSDSLPKGKEFPELIAQAARHCVVAVVVLSYEYLTSKWPMLELVAFVEAKRTCNPRLYILPVFYKLNVEDLKDTQRWKTEWQRLGALDTRKFEEALRVLARSNGERFSEYGNSEVRYRKAIVAGLYRLSRPYLKYCSPPMVGRSRLRQILAEELERQSRVDGTQPAVIGMYGLGGMGKTLLCRSMCNYYREEYAGRVCHVECSKSSSSLELQNLILEELTDGRKPVFDSSEEALSSIALHLPREAVFLAMDNVQEADVQWLQSILNGNHNAKSKFLVTSRSASNVQSVMRNKGSCWAIEKQLSLTENEALELFIRSAVPTLDLRIPCSYLTDQQILNILKDCIKECFFGTGAQGQGQYYYPMLLQALGSSIKEHRCSNFLHFIDKCRRWGKLHHFHKHPVFEILRTEYDALHTPRWKLLFLDVALFAPRQKLLKLEDLCSWLEGMYDCSRDEILHKLKKLRKSSLIEDWESNKNQITLHDLYRDFAAYELQEVEADKRWAVYHKSISTDLPQNLASSPPGRNWPDLVRIYIKIESQLPGDAASNNLHVLPSIVLETAPMSFPSRRKIQQWENVQLLCLQGFESAILDIGPLKCLRSLKLTSYSLRTLKGTEKLEQLRFVELNCSGLKEGLEFPKCSKLQELVTGEIHELRSLRLPESLCSSLKLFKLHGWNGTLPRELELGHHRELTEVAIAHTIWDISGRVNWSLSLLGLEFLTRLIGLTLINLPVCSLPGLENLVSLKFLNVRGCACLEVLPDLRSLLLLKWVSRHGCLRLPRTQPLVSSNCRVTTSG